MPRPKQSRFMGQRYKIEYAPKVIDEDDPESGHIYGFCSERQSKIIIEDGLDHEREREVLIHEVIHQLVNMSAIGFKDDIEEKIASFFGLALLAHIRDNKRFWQHIFDPPPPEEDEEETGEAHG